MQKLAWISLLLTLGVAQAQPNPGPPPADDPEMLRQAKTHFEAGRAAYNNGDYQTAVREFKAAELLRSSPVLNYNIGLAQEKLNHRKAALRYYRLYLEQLPSAPNRAEVESKIATLESQRPSPSQQPPPEVGNEMPPEQPPPSEYDPYAGQQPTQLPPPKKKSYWWVSLVVIGGVVVLTALIVGVYFYERDVTSVGVVTPGLRSNPNQAATLPRSAMPEATQRSFVEPQTRVLFRF
jgi:tetratricopeptide (TPR) repeat protein